MANEGFVDKVTIYNYLFRLIQCLSVKLGLTNSLDKEIRRINISS